MTLYVSQYLNIYPSHRKTHILFHGITGAIDEVDDELAGLLRRHKSAKAELHNFLPEVLLEFLKRRGHVTDLSSDRERVFFTEYVTKLHATIMDERMKSGSLMIVPSYNCNLACAYCYQQDVRSSVNPNAYRKMTSNTVTTLFERTIKNLYPAIERLSRLSINIYGGEPFLAPNREALERIFYYTTRYQMPVSAISNATHLETVIDYFGVEKGLVNSLQVSFDGDPETHDKSRITPNGKGTFEKIVANIHRLIDRNVQISLRINTAQFNVKTLHRLTERLEREEILSHPNVVIYSAAIHSHYGQAEKCGLFSPARLSLDLKKEKLPAIRTPLEKQKGRLRGIFDQQSGIVLKRTHFCMQNMKNAFLVDPLMDIYSCYEEAGNRSLRVGEFQMDGSVHLNDTYRMYQSRHVAAYEPCASCSVALTCGGGCPVAARGESQKGSIFTNWCDSHRELVAMSIRDIFKDKTKGEMMPVYQDMSWLEEKPYA